MPDDIAPSGTIWVCTGCGKRSRDRSGRQAIDRGWDVACHLHAVLCREDSLVVEGGRVVKATAADAAEWTGG